ncbi:hypothetical protein C1922_14755 [Stenotrophomonas sp. ZAC14D2_NAIMI4_7]|uniref:TnsA endonuclease N-terminal domain-containing protein n=1 Tax=Stenotrophomonas sp. ZAC14D2_NAIMI4_7 TaxID=2072405 RepID=UPI000D53DCE0|nr:TnsA endonuclease N-terminal domain-containing protein [Stenotrophomonas sp. ZAC14D2_NAIMI4_7]AWH18467.1 hypothetical protein C1922_14755 [Stenotrophomonas sp. ZAC14D2_NAIMI4_7]
MSRKFSLPQLELAFKQGRGIGVGEDYRPWIQITRNRSSPLSNLRVTQIPYMRRSLHCLSRGEAHMVHYLRWLGASDIREQYPMWNWPHAHPLAQLREDLGCGEMHPGMAAVAEKAQFVLRTYPGTDIRTVLTMDLMVTVPAEINKARLVAISCKPLQRVLEGREDDREIQRLELDRLYCEAGKIPFVLAHPEQLPRTLIVQLEAYGPVGDPDRYRVLASSSEYADFVDRLDSLVYTRPAMQAARRAAKGLPWDHDTMVSALRTSIWHQHIDVDLATQISLARPLRPGGKAFRAAQAAKWLGGRHEA